MSGIDYANLKLTPNIKWLKKDYVLIQAWKKAQQYIRNHNWYADTLELDTSTIELPFLVDEWSNINHESFKSSNVKLVPAPKANSVKYVNGDWILEDDAKLRPLAHIPIREQTLAVACMMCLADLVETQQGNTDQSPEDARKNNVVSYGNRLFCHWDDKEASFGWGNSTLYSKYYQDYKRFIERPDYWKPKLEAEGKAWVEVQVDLSQFYDRISPDLLHQKVLSFLEKYCVDDYADFFSYFKNVFNWEWDEQSIDVINECEAIKNVSTDSIALPQGLVASGFFANIVLHDFDEYVSGYIDYCIGESDLEIYDYCRYVDDMRFMIVINEEADTSKIENIINNFVSEALGDYAEGLEINLDKSKFLFSTQSKHKIPISKTMRQIQSRVSGPMDLDSVWEVTDALQGLLATKSQNKSESEGDIAQLINILPDVRQDTILRFAANRIKKSLRLARVLSYEPDDDNRDSYPLKTDVDERMDIVSRQLIESFINEPANVRLLSVAFDINPNYKLVEAVLDMLINQINTDCEAVRLISSYCIAELFRASATQIGFVRNQEELPSRKESDIETFRAALSCKAESILEMEELILLPWYVREQVLLYLAVQDSPDNDGCLYNDKYGELHRVLATNVNELSDLDEKKDLAIILIAYQIQGQPDKYAKMITKKLISLDSIDIVKYYISVIACEYPDILGRLYVHSRGELRKIVSTFRPKRSKVKSFDNKTAFDLAQEPDSGFHCELGLLKFIAGVIEHLVPEENVNKITLDNILFENELDWIKLNSQRMQLPKLCFCEEFIASKFAKPSWLNEDCSWKWALGQLMCSAITGHFDATYRYAGSNYIPQQNQYNGIKTSYYKRQNGLFTGRSKLGSPDIAISPWLTELLAELLAWPGQQIQQTIFDIKQLQGKIRKRIINLRQNYVKQIALPVLDFDVKKLSSGNSFKIAIVQTVLPKLSQLAKPKHLNEFPLRDKQRNHFMAVLQSIDRMFRTRKTHKPVVSESKYVDMVILPELSIHIDDLYALEQFSKQHKCIIFGGLIYHEHPIDAKKLVNQGVWIIPYKHNGGLRTHKVYQGKGNLAPLEVSGVRKLIGYRPCQWIINFKDAEQQDLFNVSASICYDATDLQLASSLRDITDCYIISALNKDVGLFDSMVTALRYHMYQHVIVANTGEFGGSTAQAPFDKSHERTIVHSHGSEQVAVKFLELPLKYRECKVCKKYKPAPAGISRNYNQCFSCHNRT